MSDLRSEIETAHMDELLKCEPDTPATEEPSGFGELSAAMADRLRSLTPARVALRRAGISQATAEVLDFQLAHGRARDAIHAGLQMTMLISELRGTELEVLALHSAASDRATYLQRPDLGRKLDEASRTKLRERLSEEQYDLAIVVADGLSALAIERNVALLLAELLPMLDTELRLAPLCIVEQARVAVGDEVAERLRADLAVVLIGERPGLSSPDSLGAYITWHPRVGRTDAERNCISNIRAGGLSYAEAAARLLYYIREARRLRLTGVTLKDPELTLKDPELLLEGRLENGA